MEGESVSVHILRFNSPFCDNLMPESQSGTTTNAPGPTPDVTTVKRETTPVISTASPEPATDCQELLDAGNAASGLYTIYHAGALMQVYCRMDTAAMRGYIVGCIGRPALETKTLQKLGEVI